jgi:uncharacterized protein YjbJ (UPF0337 family)
MTEALDGGRRGTRLATPCCSGGRSAVAGLSEEDIMADDRTTTDKGVDNNLRGKGKGLKGRLKDAAGGLTNDSSLQAEGKLDKLKGKVQDKVGDVQRRVGRK